MRHILLLSVLFILPAAHAASERVDLVSEFSPQQTIERFVGALEDRGIPVFEEDDLGSANEVIFANPLFGENIGMCGKGLRKDQPMKARVWKDDRGITHFSYESPRDRVNQFGVIECGHETDNLRKTLKGLADSATED